jgi:hypothetical protein
MARVRRQRRQDEIKAELALARYEVRRAKGGTFGIYVRGTNIRCGTLFPGALGFQRALASVCDAQRTRERPPRRYKRTGKYVGQRKGDRYIPTAVRGAAARDRLPETDPGRTPEL